MAEEMKTIKVKKSTYDKIDKLRTTEKGKVGFDSIINWIVKKHNLLGA